MNFAPLIASLALALAAPVFAHGDAHAHQPLHGGVVAEAGDLDFELVAKAERLTLYVRDHGKPAALRGASARLTLLSGGEKSELALAPVGEDRLEASTSHRRGPGSKALASVSLAGRKPVLVRFVLE
jgi:hypothetical protein